MLIKKISLFNPLDMISLKKSLYPQRYAQIMAERIPRSQTQSTKPQGLRFA